jgi:hypothetical protein
MSARYGFEIGLIPLRWVSLVISGSPLFDGVGTERVEAGLHLGLAQIFPWIITGIGGVAACLAGARIRTVHVLLASWLALHVSMMLAYRDLHMLGFWLYGNYHYFKVTQPVFLLFSIVLLQHLFDRRRVLRCAAASLTAIVLAFGWRAALVQVAVLPASPASGGMVLPSLDHLQDAAILQGNGSWKEIYSGKHRIVIGTAPFGDPYDFRIYPRARDLVVVPLRPLPAGQAVLMDAAGLRLVPGAPVVQARQQIDFGLPCLFNLAGTARCGTEGAPLIP